MTELLPCPFCGREPRLTERAASPAETGRYACVVACYGGKHAAHAHHAAVADTAGLARAEAIAAWNRRAAPRPPVQQGEAVAWASDEALRRLSRGSPTAIDALRDGDAIHPLYLAPPSREGGYAETVAPYAAALAMIKEAIGELFGPSASIESDDAELLRGPEPHHTVEAIIASLQRVNAREEGLREALTFDDWWRADGQFIDPDTSDVPWFDKRRGLAEAAFAAGRSA